MFMLKGILRAESQERILMFLLTREKGYAKGIADFFDTALTPVKKQLLRLEEEGVVVSFPVGNVREYQLSPRYFFRAELVALLERALKAYPQEERKALLMNRRRPRDSQKPLRYERQGAGS